MHGCRKEKRQEQRQSVYRRIFEAPGMSLPGLSDPRDSRRAFLLSVVMSNTVLRPSRNWGRR